jgi:hypothetical protein
MGRPEPSSAARVPRRASFLLILFLLAAFAFAGVAHALSVPSLTVGGGPASTAPSTALLDDEGEEEGEFGEECDEDECESEEEDEEWKAWKGGGEPPVSCVLRSADTKAVVSASHKSFGLIVHYTAFEPTATIVSARLSGGKGSLRLSLGHQNLAETGVLKLTEFLSETELDHALDAKALSLQFKIPSAPSRCKPAFVRNLKVKHATDSLASFSQTSSSFGG